MHVSEELRRRPVTSLVEAAARRRTLTVAVHESAIAAAFLCSGIILLLLLGTQILDWYWIALLAAAGCVFAVLRTRRQLVSRYKVAQLVDRRSDLQDALSTAWFLIEQDRVNGNVVAARQIQSADEKARQVDPAAIFPFRGQRAWSLALAAAAVAFGLFALRYLVTGSLDLKTSLVPLQLVMPGEVIERIKDALTPEKARTSRTASESGKSAQPIPSAADKNGREKPGERAQEKGTSANASGSLPGQKDSAMNQTDAHNPGEKDPASRGQGKAGESVNQNAGADDHPSLSREGESAKSDSSDENQPSGLVGKMKQALSSLMAKMRGQTGDPSASSKGQNGQEAQSGEHAASPSAQQSQNDQRASNQGQSAQDAGSDGQAQGSATEKTTGSESRASAAGNSNKGSDSHSGIGTQDGEKAIKEAEQLKAMGKLEEIIGKRSADLTGDMSVETFSGEQHLKSQYSGRVGRHSDLGGEIDRNEIPVALQNYVREYMEHVRKQPEIR